MKNDKSLGLGDLFIVTAFVLMALKLTGVITTSWMAISNFSIFVLIYLVICFILDVIITVVGYAIDKKRGK